MMEQGAEFAILRVLDYGAGGEGGDYGDGDAGGGVGGEVVEVDSLVGAAGCENYLLGLIGDGS